eukprot:gene8472-5948_t
MSKWTSSGWRYRRCGPISEVLKLETFDLVPKRGEAVIQMILSPLHRSDAAVINGTAIGRRREMSFPRVGGSEGVGRVVRAGAQAKVKDGDLVWIPPLNGTWAKEITVAADQLHRVDSKYTQLAATASSFLMADYFLHQYREMSSGSVVIQNGGSSLTALAVSALAAGMPGVEVHTAASPGPRFADAQQRHRKYGSVLYEYTPSGKKAMERALGTSRANLFLNGVGGEQFDNFLKLMKPGAADVVSYGAQNGPGLFISGSNFIFPEITMHGFYLPKILSQLSYEDRQAKLDDVLQRLAAVDFSYPTTVTNSLENLPSIWDESFVQGGRKGMLSDFLSHYSRRYSWFIYNPPSGDPCTYKVWSTRKDAALNLYVVPSFFLLDIILTLILSHLANIFFFMLPMSSAAYLRVEHAIGNTATPSGALHYPPPSHELLDDIQLTEELIHEYRHLKQHSSTSKSRKALLQRIQTLKHRLEQDATGCAMRSSNNTTWAPQTIGACASLPNSRPSPPHEHLHRVTLSLAPTIKRPSPVVAQAAVSHSEMACRWRSTVFALRLAESHYRKHIQHKWHTRWLALQNRFLHGVVEIAVTTTHQAASNHSGTISRTPQPEHEPRRVHSVTTDTYAFIQHAYPHPLASESSALSTPYPTTPEESNRFQTSQTQRRAEKERIAAERAEKERIAAERAEAERIAAERAEKERIAAERAEKERIAAERAEAERIAAERAEKERIAAERAEKERIAAERAEAERIAAERAEAERIAAERAEAERIAAERAEKERIAAERAEKERIAAERAEAERIAAARAEAERIAAENPMTARKLSVADTLFEVSVVVVDSALVCCVDSLVRNGYADATEGVAAERAEKERIAAERAEKERIAAERAEAERIAAERAEAERIAAESVEKERIAAERAEKERIAAERAEAERIAAESAEAERIAAERAEAERIAAERAEAERIAAERAEKERIAAERAEAERIAAERAEAERIAAERTEAQRIAAERAEKERIAAERAEAQRIAAERAEKERIAAERTEAQRIAAERAEKERIAAERAEAERIAAERAEKERIAAERTEAQRIAAERAEKERIAAERAEAERIAAERAEKERIAAERTEAQRIAAEMVQNGRASILNTVVDQMTARKLSVADTLFEMSVVVVDSALMCCVDGLVRNGYADATEGVAAERAEKERIAAERAEAERIAAERAEAERIAAERAEAERIAAESVEKERIAAERAEAERIAAERAEKERIAAERAEAERLAAESAEAERIAAERAEKERIAAERTEAQRIAAEMVQNGRASILNTVVDQMTARKLTVADTLFEMSVVVVDSALMCCVDSLVRNGYADATEGVAAERAEKERIAAERAEAERIAAEMVQNGRASILNTVVDQMTARKLTVADTLFEMSVVVVDSALMCCVDGLVRNGYADATEGVAAERAEKERIAAERAEAERIAAERAEAERIAAERAEAERIAAESVEKERIAAESAEAERIAAESVEKERIAAERAEAERIAAERAEKERIAAERAEAERLAAESAEAERIAAESVEKERIAAERAEAERIAAERAEAERIAAESGEKERIAAERAEAERIAAESAEAERIAAERAEKERIAAERAEAERIAVEDVEVVADVACHGRDGVMEMDTDREFLNSDYRMGSFWKPAEFSFVCDIILDDMLSDIAVSELFSSNSCRLSDDGSSTRLAECVADDVLKEVISLVAEAEARKCRGEFIGSVIPFHEWSDGGDYSRAGAVVHESRVEKVLDAELASAVALCLAGRGSECFPGGKVTDSMTVEWLTMQLNRLLKHVVDKSTVSAEEKKGRQESWRAAVEGVASRVAEDCMAYASLLVARYIQHHGINGAGFKSQKVVRSEAFASLRVRDWFAGLPAQRLQTIILCYVDLARRGVSERSDFNTPEMKKNLFSGAAPSAGLGGVCSPIHRSPSVSSFVGFSADAEINRSGLRELVLDSCVDRLAGDAVLDTTPLTNLGPSTPPIICGTANFIVMIELHSASFLQWLASPFLFVMDPLQFLLDCKGKEVLVTTSHQEELTGILVAADDHGNIALKHTVSSYTIRCEEEPGHKRHYEGESVRVVRGALIECVTAAAGLLNSLSFVLTIQVANSTATGPHFGQSEPIEYGNFFWAIIWAPDSDLLKVEMPPRVIKTRVASNVGAEFSRRLQNTVWTYRLCQLTTSKVGQMKESAIATDERSSSTAPVKSDLQPHALHRFRGDDFYSLVIAVPKDSEHYANLLACTRCSIMVGHTDPQLFHWFKELGTLPPRATLSGSLELLRGDLQAEVWDGTFTTHPVIHRIAQDLWESNTSKTKEESATISAREREEDERRMRRMSSSDWRRKFAERERNPTREEDEERPIYVVKPDTFAVLRLRQEAALWTGATGDVQRVWDPCFAEAPPLCRCSHRFIKMLNLARQKLVPSLNMNYNLKLTNSFIFDIDEGGLWAMGTLENFSDKTGAVREQWSELRLEFGKDQEIRTEQEMEWWVRGLTKLGAPEVSQSNSSVEDAGLNPEDYDYRHI